MSRRGNYYRDENRANRNHQQTIGGTTSVVLWVVDILMLALSSVAAVLLLLSFLAPVLSPQQTPLFVFMGLFYQVIYLVNVACALWWVVRWKRWFFFSAAVLLLGAGNISLFYRADWSTKEQEVETSKEDLTIVTYNVGSFGPEKEKCYDGVAEWLNEQQPTIVCLQEAYFYNQERLEYFRSQLNRLSYARFVDSIPEKNDNEEVSGSGFMFLSDYPIVRCEEVDVDSLNVNAVMVDVKIGRDTLRVYNLHLQSTGITGTERNETLTRHIISDTMARTKLTNVAEKMANNYVIRADEVDGVAKHISLTPHPVILCGDFNDTPVSYAYNTIRRTGLTDAYMEKGKGVEHTFRGLYNLFRIDYVMVEEEEFVVKQYESFDLDYSDHKALKVRIMPTSQEAL